MQERTNSIFFGKTISLEHLEKENIVFSAVLSFFKRICPETEAIRVLSETNAGHT